uniref:Uncharacterized protein n=1 Tax=Glossina pallidipes TaxID=7398 RepID=A0A1A9ZTM8_GLOPL
MEASCQCDDTKSGYCEEGCCNGAPLRATPSIAAKSTTTITVTRDKISPTTTALPQMEYIETEIVVRSCLQGISLRCNTDDSRLQQGYHKKVLKEAKFVGCGALMLSI